MPLTKSGKKMEGAMEKEYGEKRGKQVFYATENKMKSKAKALKKMCK